MAGIEVGARDLTMEVLASPIQAPLGSAARAAVIAGFSKVLVGVLMHERR
jgi:hypothetical protein